jgi:hypothetical protein
VIREQPAQVPTRDAQPATELGLGAVIERTVQDQPYGTTDQARARSGNWLWGSVRPAAQAGAKA